VYNDLHQLTKWREEMTDHELYTAAQAAGNLAVAGASDGYPCGFAWILIQPARGHFVKFLKANNIGRKGTYGGYDISSYDACWFRGQNMYVKQEGCEAFAAVLRANGINATVQSRID
jgi:hypothetical protein